MRAVLPAHGRGAHGPNGPDPIPAKFEIKLFGDDEDLSTGDGRFYLDIDDDLGGTFLRYVRAFVSTAGSSATIIQLHNVDAAVDMLSTRVTIDSSEKSSRTATPYVIDQTGTPPNNYVEAGQQVRIDIDSAGTGAKGLGISLHFGPDIIYLTP